MQSDVGIETGHPSKTGQLHQIIVKIEIPKDSLNMSLLLSCWPKFKL